MQFSFISDNSDIGRKKLNRTTLDTSHLDNSCIESETDKRTISPQPSTTKQTPKTVKEKKVNEKENEEPSPLVVTVVTKPRRLKKSHTSASVDEEEEERKNVKRKKPQDRRKMNSSASSLSTEEENDLDEVQSPQQVLIKQKKPAGKNKKKKEKCTSGSAPLSTEEEEKPTPEAVIKKRLVGRPTRKQTKTPEVFAMPQTVVHRPAIVTREVDEELTMKTMLAPTFHPFPAIQRSTKRPFIAEVVTFKSCFTAF